MNRRKTRYHTTKCKRSRGKKRHTLGKSESEAESWPLTDQANTTTETPKSCMSQEASSLTDTLQDDLSSSTVPPSDTDNNSGRESKQRAAEDLVMQPHPRNQVTSTPGEGTMEWRKLRDTNPCHIRKTQT